MEIDRITQGAQKILEVLRADDYKPDEIVAICGSAADIMRQVIGAESLKATMLGFINKANSR